jgi:hypothetical protein
MPLVRRLSVRRALHLCGYVNTILAGASAVFRAGALWKG